MPSRSSLFTCLFQSARPSLTKCATGVVLLIIATALFGCDDGDANLRCPSSSAKAAAEFGVGYDYEGQDWYKALLAMPTVKTLMPSDFANGTFRIRASGKYVLGDDIAFAPRPEADYWPPYDQPDEYPMGTFYLGFFAAITIEVSDVWIDLNGHRIQQSDLFYQKQRFFNTIELADRIFDSHEGVASLNFQTNDKLHFGGAANDFSEAGIVGEPAYGTNVLISNGILGQSSHNGIHTNFGSNVVLKDLVVRDFEVAGIQLNGVNNVAIVNTIVGPNHQQMPAYAALSNAIHTSRMIDYIMYSLPRLGLFHDNGAESAMTSALESLLDETITYSGRKEGLTVRAYFERIQRALRLWFGQFPEDARGLQVSAAEDQALLDEFKAIVENPSGLADGSVVYGIKLHRRGAGVGTPGAQDEPFYGPEVEVENVTLRNVTIANLKARPVITPALVAADGTVIQGPVRDTFDVIATTYMDQDPSASTSGLARHFKAARYYGDVLHDAYGAMWKLSNTFYNTYIIYSECGNFGSNLTAPFTGMMFQLGAPYTGSEVETVCHKTSQTTSLRGRDVAMLQKRLFGSLAMTQQFYDWMTAAVVDDVPSVSLEDLLSTPQQLRQRKRDMHTFACHGDAMFHPMKGVVGLVVEFQSNVQISGVRISDLVNTGDSTHWFCDGPAQRKLYKNTENTKLASFSGGQSMSADVRGLQLSKSKQVRVDWLSIDVLASSEGGVIGVDVVSDVTGDRLDWHAWPQRTLEILSLSVGSQLTAGRGGLVSPFKTQQSGGLLAGMSNLDVSPDPIVHHQYDTPRVSFNVGASSYVPHDFASSNQPLNGTFHRERFMAALRNDVDFIYRFRNKSVAFLEETFGLKELRLNGSTVTLKQAVEQVEWWENIKFDKTAVAGDGSEWRIGILNDGTKYNVHTMCWQENATSNTPTCRGDLASQGAEIIDLTVTYIPSYREVFYGTFGKEQGVASNSGPMPYNVGDVLLTGFYLLVGLPAEFLGGIPIPMEYYAACPISVRSSPGMDFMSQFRYHAMINCEIDSSILGRGNTVGTWTWYSEPEDPNESTRHRLAGSAYMIFDDVAPKRRLSSPYSPAGIAGLPTLLRDLTDSPTVAEANGGRRNNYVPELVVQVVADGWLPTDPMQLALQVHPLGKSRGMFKNEALKRFLTRWLPDMADDSSIRAMRAEFIDDYLVSYMGLTHELNTNLTSARFLDDPIDNRLDLGGTNVIMPYALNENTGAHATVWAPKNGSTRGLQGGGETTALEMTPVYEAGFALLVGRAGISIAGTPVSGAVGLSLPYGTILRYGYKVFVIEGDTRNVVVMHFRDKFPAEPNFQMHYEMLQTCRIVAPVSMRAEHNNSICVGFEQVNPAPGGGSRYKSRWAFMEQAPDMTTRQRFSWQDSLTRGTGNNRWAYSFEDALTNNITGGSTIRMSDWS